MLLADLAAIPSRIVPSDYTVRRFECGDEEAWLAIHRAADDYHVFTPAVHTDEFGDDSSLFESRQLFAINGVGRAVGTVTAWLPQIDVEPRCGRLHWLAVVPAEQGKGLGAALITAGLERLRQLGYERAYLTTSTSRTTAVHLYEQFGFRRVARSELAPHAST